MRYLSSILVAAIALLLQSCMVKNEVIVNNTTSIDRIEEPTEIAWHEVVKILPSATGSSVIVLDADGNQAVCQTIYCADGTPTALLFAANVAAKSSEKYTIAVGEREDYVHRTFGRFVPERMDDFAWENDKVAFRIYGPALEKSGELSNGVDIWTKSTDKLVINKWYAKGYNYHQDMGEGMDFYKVGPTLGAGTMAPYVDGSIVLGRNFISHKVLFTGALRTSFEVSYAPLNVDGVDVTERRIYTLDAGNNLNKVEVYFDGDFSSMDCVVGITRREGGELNYNQELGSVRYYEPTVEGKGNIAVATYVPGGFESFIDDGTHLLSLISVESGKANVFYFGGDWSKSKATTFDEWNKIVESEIERINNSL